MMERAQFDQELQELEGKLQVSYLWKPANEVTPKLWSDMFGEITPKQIFVEFAKAVGNADDVKLEVMVDDLPCCWIYARHKGEFGKDANFIEFKAGGGEATLERAIFDEAHQGKDITKRYLGTAVELLKKMNVEVVNVAAHTDNELGGYAWAKYGFCPTHPEQCMDLKVALSEKLRDDGESIKFETETYPLLAAEKKVIENFLGADDSKMPEILPHLTELNRVLIEDRRGHKITVGKALLMGTEWCGELPLEDGHPGYERFKTYTASAERRREAEGV